jgi:hypothetical protein
MTRGTHSFIAAEAVVTSSQLSMTKRQQVFRRVGTHKSGETVPKRLRPGNINGLQQMRAVSGERDDPHLARAEDVKRPWISMKLGEVDYRNYFRTPCDADVSAVTSQPTAGMLRKRSEDGISAPTGTGQSHEGILPHE